MSVVKNEKITAFNLKTKEKERPMRVTNVIRYEPTKVGGNPRYRLAGVDVDTEDGMSKFCGEEFAKAAAKELKLSIEEGHPKEKKEKVTKKPTTAAPKVTPKPAAKVTPKAAAKFIPKAAAETKKSTTKKIEAEDDDVETELVASEESDGSSDEEPSLAESSEESSEEEKAKTPVKKATPVKKEPTKTPVKKEPTKTPVKKEPTKAPIKKATPAKK